MPTDMKQSVMSYVFLMLFTLSHTDTMFIWCALPIKLGVASVRSHRRESHSKYAAYSVEGNRRYYAIRENCCESLDVTRRMTTLLRRSDNSGRLSARYSDPVACD